jgi:DNA primase
MKVENLTFGEAITKLGLSAGINLEELTKNSGPKVDNAVNKESIFKINELASKFYNYILFNKPQIASEATKYLESRGINQKIANKFMLGVAPKTGHSLYDFLVKRGFSNDQILASGLCGVSAYGPYDRFKNRLMFTICNPSGQVIGFSGRSLPGAPADEAKYINTSETLVYHKRESLYGLNITKDAIKKLGTAVIVEGEFDLITPYEHGLENFVAIKGSAFTIEQVKILKRYCA